MAFLHYLLKSEKPDEINVWSTISKTCTDDFLRFFCDVVVFSSKDWLTRGGIFSCFFKRVFVCFLGLVVFVG